VLPFCSGYAMMLPLMRKWSAVVAFLLLMAIAADAQSQRKARTPLQAQGTPGRFDYYVLSLSWSPQYCSDPSHAGQDVQQCGPGRRFAFVTHGLWPNNSRPPHPSNCGPRSPVPAALKDQMLPIMPSAALIQHEWDTHGTCSGVSQQDYFSQIRSAFRLVTIPEPYREPTRDLHISATEIRRNFTRSNAQFPQNSIRLDCGGKFLREVRICLDKNLMPQACASAVQDTCGNRTVTMLRVR
jgi:ribonuclease T2